MKTSPGIEFLGTIEERKDELFDYLTRVRGLDLERKYFEYCCVSAGDLETIHLVDKALISKELVPEPNETERRSWFRKRRSSFIPVFQGVMAENVHVLELKYKYIWEAAMYGLEQSPYQDLPKRGLTKKGQFKIFVHGGIGDECIFLNKLGFTSIEYNEVNGSETQRYAAHRLQRQGLYDAPESCVSLEGDPMGKGMYTTPQPWQDVVKRYNLIVSSDIFGWIKHPIYTIMNLGRIMERNAVLALLPLSVDYPLKENMWLAVPAVLIQFMVAMGFRYNTTTDPADIYPLFTLEWASHVQKHNEEWLI